MAWIRTSQVFKGDTEALSLHTGHRVRILTTPRHSRFDGVASILIEPIELVANTQGFIASPREDCVLIAMSTDDAQFDTLDRPMLRPIPPRGRQIRRLRWVVRISYCPAHTKYDNFIACL